MIEKRLDNIKVFFSQLSSELVLAVKTHFSDKVAK